MRFTAHYESPLGGITVDSDGEGLTGLRFDGQKHFADTPGAEREERTDLPLFAATRRWLDVYFSGGVPDFSPTLHLSGSTLLRLLPLCGHETHGQSVAVQRTHPANRHRAPT